MGRPRSRGVTAPRPLVAGGDGEESIPKSLRRLFMAADLDAEVYASGQDFLESLRGHQPDCLVLDLQMPGLTGLEVQRALIGVGVRFPTIIITAHDEPEARARCMAAGVDAYLCKPLHDEMLLDAIAGVMGRVAASAVTQKPPRS